MKMKRKRKGTSERKKKKKGKEATTIIRTVTAVIRTIDVNDENLCQ